MSWFRLFSTLGKQKRYVGGMGVASAYYLYTSEDFKKPLGILALNNATKDKRSKRPVYLWGNNLYGVADPTTYGKEASVKYPRQVQCWQDIEIVDISLSEQHGAAVDAQGNVYQWGEAFWRKSGIVGTFLPVCTLRGHRCTSVHTNPGGVYLIDDNGRVIVLSLDARRSPQIVPTLNNNEKIVDLHAGASHLIALSSQGKVYTAATNRFGNIFGQLGRGPTDSTKRAMDQMQRPPVFPKSLLAVVTDWPHEPKRVDQADAVTADSAYDQPDSLFADIHFDAVEHLRSGVVQIAAGDQHSLALAEDGTVYGFGSNEWLQLAQGDYDPAKAINPYPVVVYKSDPADGLKCTRIACAADTSFFVLDSQDQTTIKAVGFGQFGELGNKSWTHAQGTPVEVRSISGLTFYDEPSRQVKPIRLLSLATGRDHCAAVMRTCTPGSLTPMTGKYGYDVYVWGGNKEWQLGLANRRHNQPVPVSMEPPDPTLPDCDYTDLALSKAGPTAENPEGTITFIGGQLQFLPDPNSDPGDPKPAHRIRCGRDVTVIY